MNGEPLTQPLEGATPVIEKFLAQPWAVFVVSGLLLAGVLVSVWRAKREEARLRGGGRWRR